MRPVSQSASPRDAAAVVLGYLNFSSGSFDPAVWRAHNELFATFEPDLDDALPEPADTAARVADLLRSRLRTLETHDPAFRDAAQARAALAVIFDRVLPEYRQFHAELLEHQPPGALERPFFLMAASQAVLAAGTLEADADDTAAIIDRLDDYVGWRPVAVLENGRLCEPYAHERVRPVPLHLAQAGTAHGRYRALVAGAIEILAQAPAELLAQADFSLAALEELAFDPRSFDFLHPAASRPNYLFGLWDPAHIDAQGNYRRLVVQQATLDGILSWPAACLSAGGPSDLVPEWRRESSAVLAGVLIMASGLSGHGPGSPLAALPLAELLPRIAGTRDAFYRWLLPRLPAGHRQRLDEEARLLRQPFGGVRRHINATLAARRARQVESVALANIFARLARPVAAERLARAVPAAAARFSARITGRIVAARAALRGQNATRAAEELEAAVGLLTRAVECGATVDPWNILGFAGQFPLHEPGGESVTDARIEDLVHVTGAILDGYAAAWRRAEAAGAAALAERIATSLRQFAAWWDRFATTTVSGVTHLSGREVRETALEVVQSLARRRDVGTVPPAGFWRREVASFSSPRSHAQAAAALLEEGDLDGAAGLLVHWASLLEGPAVERHGPLFLAAAGRWITAASRDATPEGRTRLRRFLEHAEANIVAIVDVIETAASGREPGERAAGFASAAAGNDADEDPAEPDESVAAAYESMVWRDSADDGVDGGMIDVESAAGGGAAGPRAVEDAAGFLHGFLGLLMQVVLGWCRTDSGRGPSRAETDALLGWRQSLRRLSRGLVRAAVRVSGRDRSPPPGMSPSEFDRLRWQRDAAAERLAEAAVRAAETNWIVSARLRARPAKGRAGRDRPERASVGGLFAALFAGDAVTAAERLAGVTGRLVGKPVLYVPLSRGGRPDRVIRARIRERLLERLASCLPRVGLVSETTALVQLAKTLESVRPAGGASVSEFDRVFEAATTALVERIVESCSPPPVPAAAGMSPDVTPGAADDVATAQILEGLSLLVPKLLETWLTHARQLRLSVLERVREDRAFAVTREFIERYGAGVFTQHLLSPASLRGILRGGVREYLERLVERTAVEAIDTTAATAGLHRLVTELSSGILPLRQAAARLRFVLESIAENHAEYRDWNSTTTQSDRGECLHLLLDFLRVKAEHERIAWTLRPVGMAHRVLARRAAVAAAAAWRTRMRDETRDTSATLVTRIAELETRSGVRLASVGDRVRRPFTLVLEEDDLEALVEPAVAELFGSRHSDAGLRLEHKAEGFLGVVGGAGVELPDWLERLSVEVDRALERAEAGDRIAGAAGDGGTAARPAVLADVVPWLPLPWSRLRDALAD